MEAVATPVATRDEVGVCLRDSIWRDGRKRRLFRLRDLARVAEDLARRRLVEADLVVDASYCLEERGTSDCCELGSEHGLTP